MVGQVMLEGVLFRACGLRLEAQYCLFGSWRDLVFWAGRLKILWTASFQSAEAAPCLFAVKGSLYESLHSELNRNS